MEAEATEPGLAALVGKRRGQYSPMIGEGTSFLCEPEVGMLVSTSRKKREQVCTEKDGRPCWDGAGPPWAQLVKDAEMY